MVTAGVGALAAAMAPALATRPLAALVAALVVVGLIAAVWSPDTPEDLLGPTAGRLRAQLSDVRRAAALALAAWLNGVAARADIDPWVATASAIASAIATARAVTWMRTTLDGLPRRLWLAAIAVALAAAALAAATGAEAAGLTLLALVPAGTLVLARARGLPLANAGWIALIVDHPARLIVATFLALCVVGAIALSLPVSAAGDAVRLVDAAFTSVSAVCATGLITLDTAVAWSGAGKLIILVLIQLGGLGIMTLSTAALGALGRRLSVRHEEAVAGLFGGEHRGLLFVALRRTLAVTFAAEAAGAIVLTALFAAHGDALGDALWRGVFTSVSAFCNAGFALQSDSLVGYQTAPAVLHVVALLIITGGLAPPVIAALPRVVGRGPVPVQAKIVLAATVALLGVGFAGFAALERRGALAGLSFGDKLHNAWFQSVTFRTAGFNSVDFPEPHPG